MKKLIFTLSMLLILFAATAQQNAADSIRSAVDATALTASIPDDVIQETQSHENHNVMAILNQFALPVVAISIVFSTFLVSLFLLLFFPWKKQRTKYRLMEKAIEAGRDIPADFFQDQTVKKSSMESSFMIIGTGLGVLVLAFCIKEEILVGISAIILFAGIGKLAAYLIDKKKANSHTENE